MQYYTFELDNESKDLCTIATPFGKFKYNRLPMGLKCSPDYAQKVMENIFQDVKDAEVYIDHIGAFSQSRDDHIALLRTILTKLQDNGSQLTHLNVNRSILFEECAVDLIGQWTVQVRGRPYKFEAHTVIDTITNLVELVRIEKKNSDHIIQKFAQCWLTHYPWPQRCIHDP